MSASRIGMWIWGTVTVGLAVFFLLIVILAGCYVGPTGTFSGETIPAWLPGMFYALKENDSLVAGILGFSGLAWSHFFQAQAPAARKKKPDA